MAHRTHPGAVWNTRPEVLLNAHPGLVLNLKTEVPAESLRIRNRNALAFRHFQKTLRALRDSGAEQDLRKGAFLEIAPF